MSSSCVVGTVSGVFTIIIGIILSIIFGLRIQNASNNNLTISESAANTLRTLPMGSDFIKSSSLSTKNKIFEISRYHNEIEPRVMMDSECRNLKDIAKNFRRNLEGLSRDKRGLGSVLKKSSKKKKPKLPIVAPVPVLTPKYKKKKKDDGELKYIKDDLIRRMDCVEDINCMPRILKHYIENAKNETFITAYQKTLDDIRDFNNKKSKKNDNEDVNFSIESLLKDNPKLVDPNEFCVSKRSILSEIKLLRIGLKEAKKNNADLLEHSSMKNYLEELSRKLFKMVNRSKTNKNVSRYIEWYNLPYINLFIKDNAVEIGILKEYLKTLQDPNDFKEYYKNELKSPDLLRYVNFNDYKHEIKERKNNNKLKLYDILKIKDVYEQMKKEENNIDIKNKKELNKVISIMEEIIKIIDEKNMSESKLNTTSILTIPSTVSQKQTTQTTFIPTSMPEYNTTKLKKTEEIIKIGDGGNITESKLNTTSNQITSSSLNKNLITQPTNISTLTNTTGLNLTSEILNSNNIESISSKNDSILKNESLIFK